MARRKSSRAPSGRRRQDAHLDSDLRIGGPVLSIGVLLAALAAAVLVWMIARFWPFTVDDTYITLRYAANLAAGHGPVYNVEPPRAEGYTSFLWMVLLSLPHLARLDAVWIAKALGVLLTAATAAVASLLAARLSAFLGPRARVLPAAMTAFWLAAYHPTAVHAVSGMETALAAFLLVLLVACAAFARADRVPVAVPALGLLLGLTRPEANPVVALILATCFFATVPPERRRRFAVWVLCQTERKLYLFGIGTDFRRLKYPFVWYNILHVVDVLSRFPFIYAAPHFREMVETITAQANENGCYTATSMYRAWKGWSFADKKRPSPWLTFLVLRIQKRWEKKSDRGGLPDGPHSRC